MRTKTTQISVTAVAALAIVALLAVVFMAGPAMAAVTSTADTTMDQAPIDPEQSSRRGNNADEYDDPIPCSEEVEPDANTVGVIDEGYYAVFDAFWDYEVGHLSNNFCPPEVTTQDGRGGTTFTRTDANTHISGTAFSIPDSYRVTVIDSGTDHGNPGNVQGPTIDIADFPFLAEGGAVSAVETENGTTTFAGNSLWWVRLDEPWTSADETSPLQIGFSTDLLEEEDWYKDANGDDVPEPPVQFRFAAVHVLKDGSPQEAHVQDAHFFAFDQRATDTALDKAKWSNVDTDEASEINMFTDEYRPMQFAFTKPGVYLVQVNVQAHVRQKRDPAPEGGHSEDWRPIGPDVSITSPVQWYTFHVGLEDGLSVEITATDETPGDDTTTATDGTVSFTVTAANGGPDAAQDAVVQIRLPEGLEYRAGSSSVAGVNYECGVISWEPGNMSAGDSNTLTFTADVGAGAAGRLAATAEIRNPDLRVLESDAADNTSLATVLLDSALVQPPMFGGVTRSIPEHASAGAHAGDPLTTSNPGARQLHYSLSGRCHDWFEVHDNGQITLASMVRLNYKEQWDFPLTVHVSDRLDAAGDADTANDDSAPVLIEVIDTEDGAVHPTVTFSLSNPSTGLQPNLDVSHPVVGYTVTLNTQLHNLPEGATPVYDWQEGWGYVHYWNNRIHTSGYPAEGHTAGPADYTVHIKWDGGGVTAKHTIEWFEPDDNHPGP